MIFRHRNNRFWLTFTGNPPGLADLEGIRYIRPLQTWTMPASVRAMQQLVELGFTPAQDTDTVKHILWLQMLAQGQALDKTHDRRVVARRRLWGFQEEGVRFLSRLDRALLYDEPGVGKTLQAVAWAERDPSVVVVAPNAVIRQWHAVTSEVGPSELQPEGEWKTGWAITNYERASRIHPVPPFTLIVDEAHYIKNWKAKRSKALQTLGERATKVLALTGTPIINRPLDLWAIFVLLRERHPGEFWGFAKRYCGAFHNGYGWDLGGATHLDELKMEMLHFSLRRTLEEVAPNMPKKRYQTVYVEVEKKHALEIAKRDERLLGLLHGTTSGFDFQGLTDYRLLNAEGLGEYQQLRHAAALAKTGAAIEWIQNHLGSGGRGVAVFSGFLEPLRRIAGTVNGVLYTGEQDATAREEAKKRFVSGESKVICLTYGAGGMGLDGLQYGADTCVLLDFPWTPAETEQAEDRLHRQGQVDSVQVVNFLSNSYIEKLLVEARERKVDVIKYMNSKDLAGA